jgi:cell division protein FtsN
MSAQQAEQKDAIEEPDFEEFDGEEEEEKGLSGLVVLVMGIVMLAAFTSIVFIAYKQGVKHAQLDSSTVPVIGADPSPTPVKIAAKPAEAQGNERAVYDRMDGATASTETLAERPEEPVARDAKDPIASIAREAAAAPAHAEDAVADRIEQLAKQDATLGVNTIKQDAAPAKPQTPPVHAQATNPVTAPTPVKADPKPPTVAVATPAPSGGARSGSHLVQVGAFGSESEANGVWSKMQGKFGAVVAGKSTDIERADLGSKGVFYRLRLGPFASSADAKAFCDSLKSRGQDCLVKSK